MDIIRKLHIFFYISKLHTKKLNMGLSFYAYKITSPLGWAPLENRTNNI